MAEKAARRIPRPSGEKAGAAKGREGRDPAGPRTDGLVMRAGYAAAAAAAALLLIGALPTEAAASFSLPMVLAAVGAALLGVALPDAFERKGSLVSRSCGGGGLADLLCEAGYRNTVTHSAGAFLALAAAAAGLPYFFGGLFGGILALALLAGYASHVVLDLLLKDASETKLPLAWPFVRGERGSAGGLLDAYILGRPGSSRPGKAPGGRALAILLLAPSLVLGAGILFGHLLTLGADRHPEGFLGFAGESLAAVPGDVVGHFGREPASALGVLVYLGGLAAARSWCLPRVERRVAVAARDDKRHVGDRESHRIVPLKGAAIDPARFAERLGNLPFGRDERLNLELIVGEKVESRVTGRGIGATVKVLEGAYAGCATVQKVEAAEEALFLPPESSPDGEDSGDPPGLVPVVRVYEISGERKELGTLGLPELASSPDLLGPGLSTVRNAVSFRSGERVLLGTALIRAGEGAREALKGTLEKYEPPLRSEAAAEKEIVAEEKREKKEREKAEQSGGKNRSAQKRNADTWREAEAAYFGFIELLLKALWLVVGGVLGVLWWVVKMPFKVLSSGRTSVLAGRPETTQPEAKVVRRRLETKALFHAGFYAVAYLRDGEGLAERRKDVELALDQFFGAFSRTEDAEISPMQGRRAQPKSAEVELRMLPEPAEAGRREPLAALVAEEMAAFWHPLGSEVRVDGRVESSLVVRAPAAAAPRSGVFVGRCNHPGHLDDGVFAEVPALPRHWIIRGTTGMGKTAFEALFATQILKARAMLGGKPEHLGMLLIDPTRSLNDAVLAQMPADRVRHVNCVDPCDTRFDPPAFNLLFPTRELQPQDLASVIVGALQNRFGQSFGTRMYPILQRAVLTLAAANLVLLENGRAPRYTIYELLETRFLKPRRDLSKTEYEVPPLREEVLSLLSGDPRWEDIVTYWQGKDATQGATTQNEQWQPIWSMIQRLDQPGIRKIFGKPGRDFDLFECMEHGHIVLLNLDKGSLQEPAGPIIGTIFFNLAIRAAAARYSRAADRGEVELLRPFVLFVDEAQDLECPEMDTILTQGRKWAIPFVAAHQYADQFSNEIQQAFANAEARVFFRATDDDAKDVARILDDPDLTPARIGGYPRHNFVLKRGEEAGGVVTCQTIKLPEIGARLMRRMADIKRLSSERTQQGGEEILREAQTAAREIASEEAARRKHEEERLKAEDADRERRAREEAEARRTEEQERRRRLENAEGTEIDELERLFETPADTGSIPREEDTQDFGGAPADDDISGNGAAGAVPDDDGDDEDMIADDLPEEYLGGPADTPPDRVEDILEEEAGGVDGVDDDDDMFDGRTEGAPS